ncbi:hypothetical protein DFR29_104112 [Tahibacter aquaticus]|uniref:Uncharacterized protein n=1 Tax=Tahibacter aquaticus TaxID=520092 RepID=A0A4R6Z2F7_9GAMM|nr:hypothetical protein DFR29_104112 [Tahibacter aquaticus]
MTPDFAASRAGPPAPRAAVGCPADAQGSSSAPLAFPFHDPCGTRLTRGEGERAALPLSSHYRATAAEGRARSFPCRSTGGV